MFRMVGSGIPLMLAISSEEKLPASLRANIYSLAFSSTISIFNYLVIKFDILAIKFDQLKIKFGR